MVSGASDFNKNNNCGATLAAGTSCTLIVSMTPAAAGSLYGSLGIVSDAEVSSQLVTLSGTGNYLANTLGVFAVPSKTSVDAAFTLTPPTSSSNGAFSFTSTSPSVASVSGNTVTVVAAGTSVITATQAATSTYASQSTTATLTVTAAAAAWSVSGSPGTAFTAAPVGTYATPDLSIPLTNSGAISGSLAIPAFTGANLDEFAATTTCSSVAPGGACAVVVRFLPTVPGVRTASLTIGTTTLNFTGTGTQVSDPYFANVSLLMHMDGTSGGTSFSDVKANGITTTGTGIQTSNTSKFAQSALFAPGTAGAHLNVSNVTNFGTGDFTIEFWMNPTAGTGDLRAMLDNNLAQGEGQQWFSIQQNGSNGLTLGYNSVQVIVTSNVIPLNSWTHVALTRSGTAMRMYANGVAIGSYTIPAGNVFGGNTILNIGQQGSGSRYYQGYMDDLRITKGVARYTGTSSFSVPAAAFPNQ